MITPLVTPNINWRDWLTNTRVLLDRSVTAPLDKFDSFRQDPLSYLITLDEFIAIGGPDENLNELTNHLFYSFLIVDDEKVMMRLIGSANRACNFTITQIPNTSKLGVIASGTLYGWRSVIEDFDSDRTMIEIRKIVFEIQSFLISQGFKKIFKAPKIPRELTYNG